MKTQKLVTRDSLIDLLNSKNQEQVIGRALVAIFSNQTDGEKSANVTAVDNGIGFTGADAHSGSISAKSFIRYGKLLPWVIEMWTKPNAKGIPRIAKYHAQLNTIALGKRSKKKASSSFTAKMLKREMDLYKNKMARM